MVIALLAAAILAQPYNLPLIDTANPGGLWVHLLIEDLNGVPYRCNLAVNVTHAKQDTGAVPWVYGELHTAVPSEALTWAQAYAYQPEDLNHDGVVDATDLAMVLAAWSE